MAYRQRAQGSRGIQPSDIQAGPAPTTVTAESLAAAKLQAIKELNQNCEAYERSFFAPAFLLLILDQHQRKIQRGVRTLQWIIALRREFYHRKAIIEASTDIADVLGCVRTYTNLGAPPFTEQDLLKDAPVG